MANMTRLTEEMVALRTKTSNLGVVKKLNVWGSGISDISVVKKMNVVEVLALSVNNISSLEPVRDLQYLEILYLRKNQIKDPNEIKHLQTLPNLKALWLDDNPFCERLGKSYRQTILRLLPNLQKLDDKDVTEYELEEALASVNKSNGAAREEEETYEDAYEAEQEQQQQQQQQQQQYYQQQQYEQQQQQVEKQQQQLNERRLSSPQQQQQYNPPTPQQNYHRQNQQSYERVVSPTPQHRRSVSPQEYCQSDRGSYPTPLAQSQVDLSEWSDPYRAQREVLERHGFRVNGMGRENGNWDGSSRPHCSYHRRLLNRNSNLLSATLCLIKELDFNSLEVIEHAVRLRKNELSTD